MSERTDLIDAMNRHRNFLLVTADGLPDETARTASTVSTLTIASLLKHVADVEEQWMAFAERGADAFGEAGAYDPDIDWEAVDAEAATNDGDWSGSEWEDDRFTLTDEDTLEALRARLRAVGARTQAQLETADLDLAHELPAAPWFEQGARWSVRRVALHLLAEISQHAGHADIIREAIDGQHTMG